MNMGAYLHIQPRMQRSMEVGLVGTGGGGVPGRLWKGRLWGGLCSHAGSRPACMAPRLVMGPPRVPASNSLHWWIALQRICPLQATGREVPIRIKYSGRQTMASTATGFGEVHAQEQVRGPESREGAGAEGWMSGCVWRVGLWLAAAEKSVCWVSPPCRCLVVIPFLSSFPPLPLQADLINKALDVNF